MSQLSEDDLLALVLIHGECVAAAGHTVVVARVRAYLVNVNFNLEEKKLNFFFKKKVGDKSLFNALAPPKSAKVDCSTLSLDQVVVRYYLFFQKKKFF